MAEWFVYDKDNASELERLTEAWPEAPIETPEVCGMILDVAREQVIAYAPAPGELTVIDGVVRPLSESVPARYVYAQLQQAKNLWKASEANGNGEIGAEGFSFTPRPLDKVVRQIIRPVSGGPDVL
ncbi:hypothetical protein ACWGR3_30920 [Streptomyces albidoflavus]